MRDSRQTFDEIWNNAYYAAIRREFEEKKPGVDCLHCSIRKNADDMNEDDFFYLHMSRPPAALTV